MKRQNVKIIVSMDFDTPATAAWTNAIKEIARQIRKGIFNNMQIGTKTIGSTEYDDVVHPKNVKCEVLFPKMLRTKDE